MVFHCSSILYPNFPAHWIIQSSQIHSPKLNNNCFNNNSSLLHNTNSFFTKSNPLLFLSSLNVSFSCKYISQCQIHPCDSNSSLDLINQLTLIKKYNLIISPLIWPHHCFLSEKGFLRWHPKRYFHREHCFIFCPNL